MNEPAPTFEVPSLLPKSPSWMRWLNPCHAVFVVVIVLLLAFLLHRAWQGDRWSDWGFGDAQTLLTLRHWQEDGWLDCRLLFTPQGYAQVVRMFDSPALRHHAHGITPGGAAQVGARIRYTHYPAGYLIPFALLNELGLGSPSALRAFAVLVSVAGLILMYCLFCRLTQPSVALLAVVFYVLSPAFLGYCDSLANQPLDDLLRFFFMLAVLQSTRAATELSRRRWLMGAWCIALLVSLCSFDYVFFSYIWLVGWTVLEERQIQWRKYLAFAAAPVLIHTLQFFQNAWYLGRDNAVHDLLASFFSKSVGGDSAIAGPYPLSQLRAATHYVGLHVIVVAALFVLYVGNWAVTSPLRRLQLPSPRLLLLLLCCGMAYILVLPGGMWMPYQGRQLVPFISLLIGATIIVLWESVKTLMSENGLRTALARWSLAHASLGSAIVIVSAILFFDAERRPVYDKTASRPDIRAAQSLRQLSYRYEPVFLSLDGFVYFLSPDYVAGYPQIHPLVEYYAGRSPILCFRHSSALAADLRYMVTHAPSRFSPVLVARNQELLTELLDELFVQRLLKSPTPQIQTINGKYILDLTDLIPWDEIRSSAD